VLRLLGWWLVCAEQNRLAICHRAARSGDFQHYCGSLADAGRNVRGDAFTIDSSQDLNCHSKIVSMIATPAGIFRAA
jgi:hypothetical protein